MLMWTCTNIRLCSRLFHHVVSHSSPEVCFCVLQSRKDTVTFGICWLVKVKKPLQSFLMVLITIVSLSSSSNKLGNNFNWILIYWWQCLGCYYQIKKVLSCNWFATNNNFWCRKELKMSISGALFEQKRFSFDNLTHVLFWKKGELFYKNPSKRSVLKSWFQNPRNLDQENWFSHDSRKNNFKFTTE